MTPKETQMMLANLLSMYPNHTINDFATDQWCRSMQDVPADAAYAVMSHWIDTEKWFPTVAEFKDRAMQATSSLPSVDEAWQVVMRRIKDTYFPEKAPRWDAPKEIQDAVKATHPDGLRGIRLSEKPDEMRRRFEKAYIKLRHGRENVTALGPNVMKELLG